MNGPQLDDLALAMVEYECAVPERIQHFFKVHSFARLIGLREGLDDDLLKTLEAAAYVHDIGIKPALEKYGSSDGPYQEQEGVAPARAMLEKLNFPVQLVDRVCWLVGHHHTYTDIDGLDYQILVEADFLVNLYENGSDQKTVRTVYEQIFRTNTGKLLCKTMFGV